MALKGTPLELPNVFVEILDGAMSIEVIPEEFSVVITVIGSGRLNSAGRAKVEALLSSFSSEAIDMLGSDPLPGIAFFRKFRMNGGNISDLWPEAGEVSLLAKRQRTPTLEFDLPVYHKPPPVFFTLPVSSKLVEISVQVPRCCIAIWAGVVI